MTMHTILPEELIFEGMDLANYDFSEVNVDGIQMQVQFVNSTQAKIVRLLSGNPNDYLNHSYAPGMLVDFLPRTGKRP